MLFYNSILSDGHSSIAQLVEQSAVNRSVVGSSPTRGAIYMCKTGFLRKTCFQYLRAYSSAVEQPAHNRLVPGSIPGGPTKYLSIWPVGQAVKTPPFHGGNRGSIPLRVTIYWAISSAGRAPALQAGCRRFDPVIAHHMTSNAKQCFAFFSII